MRLLFFHLQETSLVTLILPNIITKVKSTKPKPAVLGGTHAPQGYTCAPTPGTWLTNLDKRFRGSGPWLISIAFPSSSCSGGPETRRLHYKPRLSLGFHLLAPFLLRLFQSFQSPTEMPSVFWYPLSLSKPEKTFLHPSTYTMFPCDMYRSVSCFKSSVC